MRRAFQRGHYYGRRRGNGGQAMRLQAMRLWVVCVSVAAVLGRAVASFAGPVILGGDDLGDHGKFNAGTMENEGGWLYIEKAVADILDPPSNITRPGNDGSIAALGSANSMATESDPGAGIRSAADALGKAITFYDRAAAINQFFADLASGNVNPAMLWISGEEDCRAGSAYDLVVGGMLAVRSPQKASTLNSSHSPLRPGLSSSLR